MHLSVLSALLAVSGGVSAAALPSSTPLAPALPVSVFQNTEKFVTPLTLEEARTIQGPNNVGPPKTIGKIQMSLAATCTNPRVRTEWDSYSTADRNNFVNAIKCLMGKPASGKFAQAKNRYEDLVALHQTLTPNVHGNSKFLIWHRYYVWTFEDILRTECGLTSNLPWFDESKYAGKFGSSSIFSADWFGTFGWGGNCVTNGKFAGITLNVGPGSGNTVHCLARNGDESKTANTNAAMVSACNQRTDYADMAACAEGGAHAWGHNGVGSVMQDTFASPGDPVFWLHHLFIDRNYRIWQNADSARVGYIDGTDRVGNKLSLDTTVSMNGLRPDVKVRDIINTMGGILCYKYNY